MRRNRPLWRRPSLRAPAALLVLAFLGACQAVPPAHRTSTELGRVSGLIWGTSISDLEQRSPSVVDQAVPNEPGAHSVPFSTRTDQIVLAITGVHDDAPTAGVAEILIEIAAADRSGS